MPSTQSNNLFRLVTDSKAIQLIPNVYGRSIQRGLFRGYGITTTAARVMEVNGVLSLIPSTSRGSMPASNTRATRKFTYLAVPHFPLNDQVKGEDVQDVVDWETGESLDTMSAAVARVFESHRLNHAITREWLQVNALQGIVRDSDGSVLVDFFNEFSITKKTIKYGIYYYV